MKHLIPICLFLASIGCIPKPNQAGAGNIFKAAVKPAFEKIDIHGEEMKNGIFDISVEYGQNDIGWLAYSRVELPKYVETHLAKSVDNGKTWTFVAKINESRDGTISYKGREISGAWRNETPSLLYDPADAPSRRWKLFSQRYFTKPPFNKGNSLYEKGWIQYQYAANPKGPWSERTPLFGKEGSQSKIDLNSLHPDLHGMSFYNEIGSITVKGTIYLSLDASATSSGFGKWNKRKIVLISSPDHCKSWRYVGTLTDYQDADNLGYLVLTGSSLVEENNRLFLLITPSGAKGLFKKNRGHDGTYVVEFEDITRAKLRRDERGNLIFTKIIKPDLHSGGLSDYHEKNSSGGILFSQTDIRPKTVQFFKAFDTKMKILGP